MEDQVEHQRDVHEGQLQDGRIQSILLEEVPKNLYQTPQLT